MEWKDKPKKERKINSQNGRCESIGCFEYRKWCENCAEQFETVNKVRTLCTKCCCAKYGIDKNEVSVLMGGGKQEKSKEVEVWD